jgi:hypothetical protein
MRFSRYELQNASNYLPCKPKKPKKPEKPRQPHAPGVLGFRVSSMNKIPNSGFPRNRPKV